ncbi:MAG: hypothetical protein EOL92_07070, partial [Bacteroidia bacterium]|nr:hypothetical protein [Bacteroidia bacterium]
KISDDDQIVYGWGMISSIDGEPYYDTDNDHISDDVVRKASTGFMLGQRISNDSHTENDVGLVVHSFPLTSEIAKAMGIPSRITGWMVGVKVDPKTLAKFKSGEYKGFSIEGLAGTEDVE